MKITTWNINGVKARIESLVTELQQKTGAEIAVLTVESTAPLDDLSFAMRVAETWKPGRKAEDTGVLVLVATKDRKLRIVTGYGIEGVLPDGLVGQIQDEEMMPSFKAVLGDDGIAATAAYVQSLSGTQVDPALAQAGATHFQMLCIACHGPEAKGNPLLGAPNLTDRVWLFGGDAATIAMPTAANAAIPATAKVAHLRDNMAAGFGRLPDTETRERMAVMFSGKD